MCVCEARALTRPCGKDLMFRVSLGFNLVRQLLRSTALLACVRLLSSDLPCVALICISDGSARRELVCAHRRLLTQTSLIKFQRERMGI